MSVSLNVKLRVRDNVGMPLSVCFFPTVDFVVFALL